MFAYSWPLHAVVAGVMALSLEAKAETRVPGRNDGQGDIPDWVGQPDQGFEGYRFVGFNLYGWIVELGSFRRPAWK